jgi:two-component system chemotaxis sensor kinase CheA
MILGSPELKGSKSPALVQQLSQLDKITRELQEMATSLRMVPLRPTFQKMARLARDLAKKSSKPVEFVTLGEETELDKTVVDRIGDPLVHMVRNSMDHGIEADPDERIRAGKPATATVRLNAFQKGGSVCIEISDDGRGLDRDRILTKAREKGLIREDAEPSDREVWNLIFEPGFSTAKQVTDISGRGVGMDVVRRNIEALRGRIEIQSRSGLGTTFSIWLPLTLAIIDGMVVRVGGERYVFPTLSILRVVPIREEDVKTVVGKGRMLSLQGRLIPLFPLNGFFRKDGAETHGAVRLARAATASIRPSWPLPSMPMVEGGKRGAITIARSITLRKRFAHFENFFD